MKTTQLAVSKSELNKGQEQKNKKRKEKSYNSQ